MTLRYLLILLLMMPAGIAMARNGNDDTAAVRWLEASLDNYFADRLSMKQITTIRYARFKTDAMNMEYDGGMSPDAFKKKWGAVYDLKQQYLHDAFLVPWQDWNKVKVVCRFVSSDLLAVWIVVDFTEEPSQEHYRRRIKLVRENGTYLIDDVLELPQQEAYYITGDFNGDKRPDTLSVSFTSRIDQLPVIIDTTLDYDTLINRTVRRKPLLRLTARNLSPLILNENNDYVLGLDYLKNVGNVDQHAGDEIAVIIRYADWSNLNLYKLLSYRSQGWVKIKEKEIKDENIPDIRSGKMKMQHK